MTCQIHKPAFNLLPPTVECGGHELRNARKNRDQYGAVDQFAAMHVTTPFYLSHQCALTSGIRARE
jgi:hypothetical protein